MFCTANHPSATLLPLKMKVTASIIAILLAAAPVVFSAPDAPASAPGKETIMKAFDFMEQADRAKEKQAAKEAMTLYGEALDTYMQIAQDYPEWQANLVRFRIAYCRDQLRALLGLADGEPAPLSATTAAPPHSVSIPSVPVPALPPNTGTPPDQPPAVDSEPPAATNGIAQITTRAKVLLSQGKFVQARLLLMKGIDIDPDHYLVRLLLGVAQCEAARFDDAALLLKQLARENPSDPHVHIALAGAYLGMGQTTNATREVSAALKLKPDMAEAHYNMVQILLAADPLDRALAKHHYRKAIEAGAKPDPRIEEILTPPAEGEVITDH